MKLFEDQCLLITGGTGSLGKVLIRKLLSGEMGNPKKIIVFSRDEAKQHFMRLEYQNRMAATDEIIYRNFLQKLEFRIGDIRNYGSVTSVLPGVDIVINTAAMKQVPTCEYSPYEAVSTNVLGAENIVRAIQEHNLPVKTVVGVSTDKACKPVNVMGMTKAIQERIFVQANMRCPRTRFICTRYGNVLASRGSVIPLFLDQIRKGGPITITTPEMTRFLLSLEDAVTLVIDAIQAAAPGETWVPHVQSSLVLNIAKALMGDRDIKIIFTGIRPGEKVHEIMISEEEVSRTIERGNHYVIVPMLPEVTGDKPLKPARTKEYSSAEKIMSLEETIQLLKSRKLMLEDLNPYEAETLR
ncbi:MAG: polysaccharide biosynthesis protein [Candidatus Aminicenantes bacterium]|nr:polysaccharide biosynthesis protein [Candidatus Aminicenantes bacterium]